MEMAKDGRVMSSEMMSFSACRSIGIKGVEVKRFPLEKVLCTWIHNGSIDADIRRRSIKITGGQIQIWNLEEIHNWIHFASYTITSKECPYLSRARWFTKMNPLIKKLRSQLNSISWDLLKHSKKFTAFGCENDRMTMPYHCKGNYVAKS